MKRIGRESLLAFVLLASCSIVFAANGSRSDAAAGSTTGQTTGQLSITGTETLVFLRHGEKTKEEIGQLNPQGLNRALALSKVLPAKYGKPDYIFAPDPAATLIKAKGSPIGYDYIRPLATIEPTAIALDIPVQTPFGFGEIDKLNAELTSPKYAHALIFIAWEHGKEAEAATKLMIQFGGDGRQIPRWEGADFDSLYVLRIVRTAGEPSRITFTHDREGLNNLSKEMPVAAR